MITPLSTALVTTDARGKWSARKETGDMTSTIYECQEYIANIPEDTIVRSFGPMPPSEIERAKLLATEYGADGRPNWKLQSGVTGVRVVDDSGKVVLRYSDRDFARELAGWKSEHPESRSGRQGSPGDKGGR
jgi:hypothetical protein